MSIKTITSTNLALCSVFVYLWLSSVNIGCREELTECSPHVGSPVAEVQISSSGVQVDGLSLALPCTPEAAIEILGEPSRVEDLENRIFVWDDKGMHAYIDSQSNLLDGVGFALGRQDLPFWPQKDYGGVLFIRSSKLCAGSNADELRRMGFVQTSTLPILFQLRMEPLLIAAESDLEIVDLLGIEITIDDKNALGR